MIADDGRPRSIQGWQIAFGIALAALGFLVATQLRTEGQRVRYASNERIPLVDTAHGLQTAQDGLKEQLLALRAEIQGIESAGQGSAALTRELDDRLKAARVGAGLTALKGQGLVLQLGDSAKPVPPDGNPTDYLVSGRDVRAIEEELWLAGAEAIAVNGERITSASAVVDIGGSILVNGAYVAPPYQLVAIGPADLFDQLNGAASFREFVRDRVQAYGIQVGFGELTEVTIPAYAGTINLRYARPVAASPIPSPAAGPSGGP